MPEIFPAFSRYFNLIIENCLCKIILLRQDIIIVFVIYGLVSVIFYDLILTFPFREL